MTKTLQINGDSLLREVLENSNLKKELIDTVAKLSIWVSPAYLKSNNTPVYECRRGRGNEKKGMIVNDIRIDDNTYANRALKEAVDKSVKFENFTVCHIWPYTTYDERYHTLLANLVMLPRGLASLSDYCEDIIDVLKYRAFELYGWYPADREQPEKPDYYPTIWGVDLANEVMPADKNTDMDDNNDSEYDESVLQDREREEYEKVKRRVPRWLSTPTQINSTILISYMKLSDLGRHAVSKETLQEECGTVFFGNYEQMKNFSKKNHGKVFEEDKQGNVRLWERVKSLIISEYQKQMKRQTIL